MARKTKRKPAPVTTTKPTTVVQDLRVDIRSVDRSRKDLSKWRQALQAAENILRPTRQLLYDLYEDIILDDHLRSVMDQRRLAVTTSNIVFHNNGKEVESISEVLKTEMFEEILEHVIDARFWGYSLIKTDFQNEVTELVPRMHVVPSKTIVVERPSDLDGIDYTKPPYSYTYLAAGKPKDLGLILIAAVLVLIKRGDLSDWAQFNEIFGQPIRVGKYDPNSPGQKEQLLEALKETGALAYIGIPVGSELTFVEANKSGATDTYKALYNQMEAAISKLIVGQTMTTENGSSRSQAEVHERVANKIAKSDRKFVLRYLNGRVREMLIAQGFSEAAQGEFKFEDEESLSKKDRLDMALQVHKEVGAVPKKFFAEKFGFEFVTMEDKPPKSDQKELDNPDDDDQEEEPKPKAKSGTEPKQPPKPKKANLVFDLSDIPEHEQPIYKRLAAFITNFFVGAPKS